MADQQTPNQANQIRVSDALEAAGKIVPFERLKWEDFPLDTRLRVLRLFLDELARLKEKRRQEAAEETQKLASPPRAVEMAA